MRRDGTHSGNIAQVGCYCFIAYIIPRRRTANDKMAVFHHRIDDGNLLHAFTRFIDSPVITDANDDRLWGKQCIFFYRIYKAKLANF